MEGVVADLLGLAQRQHGAAGRRDGAAPQRIGWQFAGQAVIGIALGTHQHGAVFEPENFRGLRGIAIDFVKRGLHGDSAGAGDFGGL